MVILRTGIDTGLPPGPGGRVRLPRLTDDGWWSSPAIPAKGRITLTGLGGALRLNHGQSYTKAFPQSI